MIRPVMTKLHFRGLGADGKPQQLMTEADPEEGHSNAEKRSNRADRIIVRRRITGPVREQNPMRLQTQRFFSRRLGRDHGYFAAAGGKLAQDIALYTVIVRNDVKLRANLFTVAG